jgi:hypothetical protein
MIRRINVATSIRDARLGPPRSRSRQPRGSLVTRAKKEEKKEENQHGDHDQKGHKQLQTQEMQDLDHQDQDQMTKRVTSNCNQ